MRKKEITNPRNAVLFLVVMLFLAAAAVNPAKAIDPPGKAKKVTIATIGVSPRIDRDQSPEKMVEQMIDFWQGQLRQVLLSKVDLIVLPEVCDVPRGLKGTQLSQYLAARKNRLLDYFASVAKENNCYIAFGSKHEENPGMRNSLILIDRKGSVAGTYHKNFPTIYEMEAGIKAKRGFPIVECDFGSVAFAICFDLNFDELRHLYAKAKPDIILFSSVYHGGLMQGIWAYSCRSYFVGSIGSPGVPSEILNPLGEVIASSTNYFNYTTATINLDYELVHLDYNKSKLPKLKAKYGDAVRIHDPGRVGSVMITSEHQNVSALQMIKEFDIELLDDYFNRSREVREKQLGVVN